jgi:hypothetical protein
MPQEGFEPTIPVFEQAKTFHALDRATDVIGTLSPILTDSLHDFPLFIQANAGVVLQLGHEHFLSSPFQFIIGLSAYYPTLCSLSTESVSVTLWGNFTSWQGFYTGHMVGGRARGGLP